MEDVAQVSSRSRNPSLAFSFFRGETRFSRDDRRSRNKMKE